MESVTYSIITGAQILRTQPALLHVPRTTAAAELEFPKKFNACATRLACVLSSSASCASGGGGVGGGGGGGDGGEVKADPIIVGADNASALSSDVIVLDVRICVVLLSPGICLIHNAGMTCVGCSASVKRILESQPLVSAASVHLRTEMTIVWPVPAAKVTPNWQKNLGEELAKHLTTCGFSSNHRREAATKGESS